MFKTKNKPIWTTPFIDKEIIVATWYIPGAHYPEHEITSANASVTGGWPYEPKGE